MCLEKQMSSIRLDSRFIMHAFKFWLWGEDVDGIGGSTIWSPSFPTSTSVHGIVSFDKIIREGEETQESLRILLSIF